MGLGLELAPDITRPIDPPTDRKEIMCSILVIHERQSPCIYVNLGSLTYLTGWQIVKCL